MLEIREKKIKGANAPAPSIYLSVELGLVGEGMGNQRGGHKPFDGIRFSHRCEALKPVRIAYCSSTLVLFNFMRLVVAIYRRKPRIRLDLESNNRLRYGSYDWDSTCLIKIHG